MNSQSSNSQSVSARRSASREENQVEHFKMSTTMKIVLALVILSVIGGGVYWYMKKRGGAGGAGGVKSLTESA